MVPDDGISTGRMRKITAKKAAVKPILKTKMPQSLFIETFPKISQSVFYGSFEQIIGPITYSSLNCACPFSLYFRGVTPMISEKTLMK